MGSQRPPEARSMVSPPLYVAPGVVAQLEGARGSSDSINSGYR